MTNSHDATIEMLSEKRKGSKLRRITISHAPASYPYPNLSEVRFVFEGEENEEKVVIIYGKDLGVGFGTQEAEE